MVLRVMFLERKCVTSNDAQKTQMHHSFKIMEFSHVNNNHKTHASYFYSFT